jgi:hypothetical protein
MSVAQRILVLIGSPLIFSGATMENDMGMRGLLEAQWLKAGKRSGVSDARYVSTVDAVIALFRDDGLWLSASTESLNGSEVNQFLGRKFQALVNPTSKEGHISSEDSVSVILSAGQSLSESDDTIKIKTKDIAPQTGFTLGSELLGLDITFPAKTSPLGFITGETTQNGHSYFCLITLFIGKKQI